MIEEQKALKEYNKHLEKEMKDKAEKDKIKLPTFTMLETFSLITLCSFVVGPIVGLFYLQTLIGFIEKYALLQNLLKH